MDWLRAPPWHKGYQMGSLAVQNSSVEPKLCLLEEQAAGMCGVLQVVEICSMHSSKPLFAVLE